MNSIMGPPTSACRSLSARDTVQLAGQTPWFHRWRTKRHVFAFASVLMFLLACWPAAQVGYMLAKANIAQWLIASAWASQNSSANARNVPAITSRPWPWADTHPVGQLHISRLQFKAWVLAGSSGRTLAFGPGLMAGSALPGQPGVSVIGGHRDTHFAVLESLRIGDVIEFLGANHSSHRYRVTSLTVADSRRDHLSLQTRDSRLLLVTCYPFNAIRVGGPLRYVVETELINSMERPRDAAGATAGAA